MLASRAEAFLSRWLEQFFELSGHRTTVHREVVAGLTTFFTMSYIVAVNPAILKTAGIPVGASLTATILTCIFGTLLMGLYANRPFAIGPYMGENAFIAFTVVQVLGYTWQSALGAVFVAGVLFILMTLFRLRQWMVDAIPATLRYSYAVGIGLFLTFIGLNQTGIVTLGSPGAPVRPGHLTSPAILLAILGFLLVTVLSVRRFPAAILTSILVTTVLSFVARVSPAPTAWISRPPSLQPVLFQFELHGLFSWGFFPVVLTILIMAFVDTMGTLIGVSARAGFLDKDGNLPQIERPMMVDALATTFAAAIGTTTSGAYIESATGVEAGGRTGLTSVTTALCFVGTLFLAPFISAIPPQAYGPALIFVGLLMLTPITRIHFDDLSELVPAFGVIALMAFTYNVGIGMTAGFVLYPFCKLVSGRLEDVRPALWGLTALSLLFFIFYPYS
jgi:AGZA family xanthine/uracil permease-like MFS transporter